jgi:hypothetical protein
MYCSIFGDAGTPLGIIDAILQFGMAGAVLMAGAGFIWYLERRERRQDTMDDKRITALNGLTAAVQECTRAVKDLDEHMRQVRQPRRM